LRHIKSGIADVPEAAVANISKETLRLIDQAAALNQLGFDLPRDHFFYDVISRARFSRTRSTCSDRRWTLKSRPS
jgi:hypothetical protein